MKAADHTGFQILDTSKRERNSTLGSRPCSIVIIFSCLSVSGAAYAHRCNIGSDLVKNAAVNVMAFDEGKKMASRSHKCTLCGSGGSAGEWGVCSSNVDTK